MGLFSEILKSNETIFKNPVALEFSFQPKLIKYREEKQHYIAECIKPLLNNREGRNLVIIGKPGVGKTVCLRHVLKELEEEYQDEIFCIYVNCWKKDTPFKFISDICIQAGYKWIQNKRIDELAASACTIMNKKSAVIVLDEIDKLQDYSVIYTLLEEIYKKTIIMITNEEFFLSELDQRIKSRLMPDTLNFEPYNLKQTNGILNQRLEWAFFPGVFDDEILEIISRKTYEMEDIRTGLFLLKESADAAENSSQKKVSEKHVLTAVSKLPEFKKRDFSKLGDEQKKLLELIKNNSGETALNMFKIYQKRGGDKTYRTFHRKIKELENGSLIKIKIKEYGRSGRTSVIEYDVNKKLDEF